jgi:hypothetical protein
MLLTVELHRRFCYVELPNKFCLLINPLYLFWSMLACRPVFFWGGAHLNDQLGLAPQTKLKGKPSKEKFTAIKNQVEVSISINRFFTFLASLTAFVALLIAVSLLSPPL